MALTHQNPSDLPVELAWMKDQTGRVLSLVQSIEAAERDRLMKLLYEEKPFTETDDAVRMACHEGPDHR